MRIQAPERRVASLTPTMREDETMRMDSRTYLNVILTVIAVLLLVLAAQIPARLDPATSAYAADKNEQQQRYLTQTSSDILVAQATEKVAKANQEVARQIGQMAKALESVGRSIDRLTYSSPKR